MNLELSADDLRPVIEAAVAEAVKQLRADEAALGDKFTYTEPEAAGLLNMEPWQLRDERREKRIAASVVRGGRIVYQRSDLLAYLELRRWPVRKGG